MTVPVIDLFAGPGGLGEGFARQACVRFDIVVSIEKDEMAHDTLRLRAAHRALSRDSAAHSGTWKTWDSIVEAAPWNVLFHTLRDCSDPAIRKACKAAEREALCMELGPQTRQKSSEAIRERLTTNGSRSKATPRNVVLIGGPPCQAYSVVGRSRNRGNADYRPEADHRHFLYLEYLHVIAEFQPAVFVMENVKGILTSRIKERQIFDTILKDLRRPDIAADISQPVEYVLTALCCAARLIEDPTPEDFIVRAEKHGVPQARHRVVIVGIRRDVFEQAGSLGNLVEAHSPNVWDVIRDLSPLRPQLSFRGKGLGWLDALNDPLLDAAAHELRCTRSQVAVAIADRMLELRSRLNRRRTDPGSGCARARARRKLPRSRASAALVSWYGDRPTDVLANHECRSHMPSDLVRYLFASVFGEVTGESPKLVDFPRCLLPQHRNVDPENAGQAIFKDRFRVQLARRHSTTVTSHIGKDGHAFIHPKPFQCRSLSVREAARLQTFPDSYVFLGNRTSQYMQVGNAVPPYLAWQIAELVGNLLIKARLA
jgi:DNA (cytosine-5)-methyltransferase 1